MYKMPTKKSALKDSKAISLDSPRVRFNWGFHDAGFEMRHMCKRQLVDHGPHDMFHVSRDFNKWYYFGYEAGLSISKDSPRPESSEAAWVEFLASLD